MTPRTTMTVACSGFLALGLITASLGPALPDLARATGAPLAALGGLISMIFLGGLASQTLSGPLTDRFGPRPVLTGGLTLLALGTLGILFSRHVTLTFACAILGGLGHGTTVVSLSLLVARTFPERNVAAQNLLNLLFGVGAIAGPVLASYLIGRIGTALPALWLGIAVVALVLPFSQRVPVPPQAAAKDPADSAAARLLQSPVLWLTSALLLTYVAIENGVAAWTTTYLQTVAGQTQAMGALVTAGFWGAVTVGRMIVITAGARLRPATLLLITVSGAALGGLLLALSGSSATMITAAILTLGLFFAPVYPTGIALTTTFFKQGTGAATSIVAAMASVGGMIGPVLQGSIQDAAGPAAGMLMVTAGTLILVPLSLGLRSAK
ncbi:MAG: putative transporter [Symbiobacteriaceae bacterium]|nr:putative transporter [Symbiobacteriaceae bacterium]